MTNTLADERGSHRFYTTVLAAFAWIALCLAAAGLWGLIAYGVARRTQEIGVRVALGARPVDVLLPLDGTYRPDYPTPSRSRQGWSHDSQA